MVGLGLNVGWAPPRRGPARRRTSIRSTCSRRAARRVRPAPGGRAPRATARSSPPSAVGSRIELADGVVVGTATDVDPDGRLVVARRLRGDPPHRRRRRDPPATADRRCRASARAAIVRRMGCPGSGVTVSLFGHAWKPTATPAGAAGPRLGRARRRGGQCRGARTRPGSAPRTSSGSPDLEEVLAANDGPAENFLLVGSDSREGVDTGDPRTPRSATRPRSVGQRSDTIMVLRREEDGGASPAQPAPRPVGPDRRHRRLGRSTRRTTRVRSASPGRSPSRSASRSTTTSRSTSTASPGSSTRSVASRSASRTPPRTRTPGSAQPGLPGAQRRAGARLRPQPPLRGVHRRRLAGGRRAPTSGGSRASSSSSAPRSTKLLASCESDPFALGDLIDAATGSVRIDEDVDPSRPPRRSAPRRGWLRTYSLPRGRRARRPAALELEDGAEPILDYFRGVGARAADDDRPLVDRG